MVSSRDIKNYLLKAESLRVCFPCTWWEMSHLYRKHKSSSWNTVISDFWDTVMLYPKGDNYSGATLLLLYLWQEVSKEEQVAVQNVSFLDSWGY